MLPIQINSTPPLPIKYTCTIPFCTKYRVYNLKFNTPYSTVFQIFSKRIIPNYSTSTPNYSPLTLNYFTLPFNYSPLTLNYSPLPFNYYILTPSYSSHSQLSHTHSPNNSTLTFNSKLSTLLFHDLKSLLEVQ